MYITTITKIIFLQLCFCQILSKTNPPKPCVFLWQKKFSFHRSLVVWKLHEWMVPLWFLRLESECRWCGPHEIRDRDSCHPFLGGENGKTTGCLTLFKCMGDFFQDMICRIFCFCLNSGVTVGNRRRFLDSFQGNQHFDLRFHVHFVGGVTCILGACKRKYQD